MMIVAVDTGTTLIRDYIRVGRCNEEPESALKTIDGIIQQSEAFA